MPAAFHMLYSPVSVVKNAMAHTVAARLLSLCVTLGERPLVRYQAGGARGGVPASVAQDACERVAKLLEQVASLSPAGRRCRGPGARDPRTPTPPLERRVRGDGSVVRITRLCAQALTNFERQVGGGNVWWGVRRQARTPRGMHPGQRARAPCAACAAADPHPPGAQQPPATLLVVDRSTDSLSPLMHECVRRATRSPSDRNRAPGVAREPQNRILNPNPNPKTEA
jgi:hypothetical protein